MRPAAACAMLATLAALASVARADDDTLGDLDGVALRNRPGEDVFALRLAMGGLHVGSRNVPVFTDGLQAGIGLGLGVRAFGEVALLWTLGPDNVAMDEHGFGARGELGLRHALATWKILYLDAEVGGGVTLIDDSRSGNHTIPAGFLGLRTGYDIARGSRNARFLEAAFDLRLYATPQGANWIFGVSFGWGK
jgi:hypothetical protein